MDKNAKACVNNTICNLCQINTCVLYHGEGKKAFYFDEIEEYLGNKTYPSTIPAQDYGSKSYFRRAAKCYEVEDGHLFYKKRLVIRGKWRRVGAIGGMDQGTGDSEHSGAVASHGGKSAAYDKIAQKFFWQGGGALGYHSMKFRQLPDIS